MRVTVVVDMGCCALQSGLLVQAEPTLLLGQPWRSIAVLFPALESSMMADMTC